MFRRLSVGKLVTAGRKFAWSLEQEAVRGVAVHAQAGVRELGGEVAVVGDGQQAVLCARADEHGEPQGAQGPADGVPSRSHSPEAATALGSRPAAPGRNPG